MPRVKKPRCHKCGKKPARSFFDAHPGVAETYFCSLRCAAHHGIQSVYGESPRWCPGCEQWIPEEDLMPHENDTRKNQGCPECCTLTVSANGVE